MLNNSMWRSKGSFLHLIFVGVISLFLAASLFDLAAAQESTADDSTVSDFTVPDSAANTIYLPQMMADDIERSATPIATNTPLPSVNRPPILAPMVDRTSVVSSPVNFWLQAEDLDGDPLTYRAVGLPDSLRIDSQSGQISGSVSTVGTYLVTIFADDDQGGTDSASFMWVVEANSKPEPMLSIVPIGSQTSYRGKLVFLTLAVTGGSQDELIFEATGLPIGLAIAEESGQISGAPTQNGSFDVRVTVVNANGMNANGVDANGVDANSASDTMSFTWEVIEAVGEPPVTNQAPVLAQPEDRSGVVGTTVFMGIGATDPDGDRLTFAADGLPPGMLITADNGIIAGALQAAGDYAVTVTATDTNGASETITFLWSVTLPPTNSSPTIMAIPNREDRVGASIFFTVGAADADGDALSFAASGLPDEIEIGSQSGIVSGELRTVGTYPVTLSVTDSEGNRTEAAFMWLVVDANSQPTSTPAITPTPSSGTPNPTTTPTLTPNPTPTPTPTLTPSQTNNPPIITNPGNRSSREGDAINLELTAFDADGDSLTFGATGLPAALSIDPARGVISGTFEVSGIYTVTVTVDDGQSAGMTSFVWNVAANNPPAVNEIVSQTSVAGDSVMLLVTATDPDGDEVAYSALGLPDGLTLNPTSGAIGGTILTAGTYTATVTADDGQAANNLGAASFMWTVEPLPIRNVSRRKLATQSSTLWQGVATRAIDGDTVGKFDSLSTTHTGPGQNAWWQVDLGTVYELTSVRIWNRTDECCDTRLEDFYVLTSNAPFISDRLDVVLNQQDIQIYHYSDLVEQQTEIALSGTGRYVRVQLAGTDYLNLAEVEVFGREIVGNLAPTLRATFEMVPLSNNTDAVENSGRLSQIRIRRNAAIDAAELSLQLSGNADPTRASVTAADYILRTDFGTVLADTVSFPAGVYERTIVVEAVDDNQPEVPEALDIQLSAEPSYDLNLEKDKLLVMLRDGEPGITADSKLLLAQMASENGAITSASGIATVRLSNDNSYGLVSSNFTGLTSPQIAAHIHVNNLGADSGPVVFSLPIGQVTDRRWDIEAAQTLDTDQAVLDALLSGGLYLNTHTVNYPDGEIRNTLLWTQASPEMQIPPDPEPIEALTGFALQQDIARFLTQAAFGPTPESMAEIQTLIDQNGGDRIAAYEAWIDAQMAMQSPSLLAYHTANRKHYFALDQTTQEQFFKLGYGVTEGWFAASMYSKNQLRERVGFALSELFVISLQDNGLLGEPKAVTSYYDMLRGNAFGPYEQLLTDVSLHPAMGWYLSHLRNRAEVMNEAGEVVSSPDENYAREIMQLFSIGLVELHPDGSLRLTQEGSPIRTYDQTTITELARVFTGWGLAVRDADNGNAGTIIENTGFNFNGHNRYFEYHPYAWTPMKMFEDNGRAPDHPAYVRYHDNGKKDVLGHTISAGQTGEQDLEQVMTILSEHPTTAPFISYRLIQRLVTSNPSAGYIYRVATTFEQTDGNLGEVVKAILLDPEARNLERMDQVGYGKKKEPLVHLTAVMRLLNAKTDQADTFNLAAFQQHGLPNSEVNLYDADANLVSLDYVRFGSGGLGFQQGPLQAPTVFNWYLPSYAPPGSISAAGLVAPEMQHATENTVVLYYNTFYRLFLTPGLYGLEPQYSLDSARTTVDPPQWLVDAYMNVMDNNGDGAITPLDEGFEDPQTVRAASAALVDTLDLYICAGRLQAQATGNPETDPREIIITGVVDTLDHRDHRDAANALAAQEDRVKEALYLVSSAPQCTMQR